MPLRAASGERLNAATRLSSCTGFIWQEIVDRENLKVRMQSRATAIEFFSRETFAHDLAKYLDFTVRHSVANLPRCSVPTSLSPAELLLLERVGCARLPKPYGSPRRNANANVNARMPAVMSVCVCVCVLSFTSVQDCPYTF